MQKKQTMMGILGAISLLAGLALQAFSDPLSVQNQQYCREAVAKAYGGNPDIGKEHMDLCSNDAKFVAKMVIGREVPITRIREITITNPSVGMPNSLNVFLVCLGVIGLLGAWLTGRED